MDPFQDVVEVDRMRLPRVRPPQEDQVRLLRFPVGARAASGPKYRRQTDDARSVSSAVAAVYIVRAYDLPRELLGRVVHLIRGLRATEDPERLRPLLARGSEPLRNPVQGFIPGRHTQRSVLTDQRFGQAHIVPFHVSLLYVQSYRKYIGMDAPRTKPLRNADAPKEDGSNLIFKPAQMGYCLYERLLLQSGKQFLCGLWRLTQKFSLALYSSAYRAF